MCMPLENFLNMIPRVKSCPSWNATGENEGIEAITFDGAPRGGQKTKIFAYLGFPKNAEGPVPGVVLVHGGGGVPFLPWVKQWNDRGYAAIAMSTTGEFPRQVNAGFKEGGQHPEFFARGMWGEFCEDGYIDAPDNDNMSNSEQQFDEQWMYHAVSGVILSHNILRQDARVDREKIGICSVSWGGVITSIAIGYDDRFAFAVPIYGSGYLTESMGFVGDYFKTGKNPELWLAEHRFDRVKIPILWQCDNADAPFSMNSNSKSYLETRKNEPKTRFSAVYQMKHSHRCAWARPEPIAFADWICKEGEGFPEIKVEEKLQILPNDANIVSLRLFYLSEPMSYGSGAEGEWNWKMKQEWQFKDLSLKNGEEEFSVTDEMKGYYFELTAKVGNEEVVVTTQYFEK